MRVSLDLCCAVLVDKPPLTGIDGLPADNRRRLLEPHRDVGGALPGLASDSPQ